MSDEDDSENDFEVSKPKSDFRLVTERLTELEGYVKRLRDDIYNMHSRMDDEGFDGDFDPIAPLREKVRGVEIEIEALSDKQATLEPNDDDREWLEDLACRSNRHRDRESSYEDWVEQNNPYDDRD